MQVSDLQRAPTVSRDDQIQNFLVANHTDQPPPPKSIAGELMCSTTRVTKLYKYNLHNLLRHNLIGL